MSTLLEGGERRNISVLVIDIVGSTSLSSQLDPEDYNDLFQRVARLWEQAIDDVEGHILKWTGDGLIAVFGFPRAHDNDASHGVTAGLRAIELTNAARDADDSIPHIRAAMHTGLALVSQVGAGPAAPVDIAGDTPAIAVRIEGKAPRDTLVVSSVSASLVDAEFELVPLGTESLKGFDEPVELFRVAGRRHRPVEPPSIRMIGRESELSELNAAWDAVTSGQSRSLLLRGDGGVGKSHLASEFAVQLRANGSEVMMLRCSELMGTTALYPVIQYVRTALDWRPGEPATGIREQLAAQFDELGIPLGAALIAQAIGVPVEDNDPTLALDPARRRGSVMQVFQTWIANRARQSPFCLIVEDLHWADPSTIELFQPLAEHRDQVPMLVIATTRPTADPHIDDVPVLELDPLSVDEAIELVEEITDGQLPNAVVEQILNRSDHVPLFISELARTAIALESDDAQSARKTAAELPLSLSDNLMTRLETLGSSRTVAAIAATIGRTFDTDLLEEVVGPKHAVTEDLARMVGAGVLVQAPGGEDHENYTFAHALVREAAYNSTTRRTRRDWHASIADSMIRRTNIYEPSLLAHHLTEAERFDEAIVMWETTARSDFATASYDESIANFTRGLALLERVDPAGTQLVEFSLQLGIGLAYATRFGYTSVEAEQAYHRANELTRDLSGPEGFPAVLGLWAYYQVRSEAEQRLELGERAHALSALANDPAIRLEGISALSTTLAFGGQMDRATELINEGLDLFEHHIDREMDFFMPQHPVAGFCGIGAPMAWSRGDFETAWALHDRCVDYAEHPTGALGPFTSAYAHTFSAWFCAGRGDYVGTAEHAKSAMAVADEHGFLVWLGAAFPHLGIATAMLGDPATGIEMIKEGLIGWRAAGSALFISYYEHGLALAHERAGDPVEALRSVGAGIEHAERHNEHFYLAELHRLRARLHDQLGDTELGSGKRRLAASVAKSQGARLFELRALVDLVDSGVSTPDERERLRVITSELVANSSTVDRRDDAVGLAVHLIEETH